MTFVIAHRAGNDLAQLQVAERLGAALVEADLRLWRGRIEVRHLKTVGPLPILWDKWRLASPFTPRLALRDVLGAARPDTHLLLDLKGRNLRLAELVAAALPADRPVTVCARDPRLLGPFAGLAHVRTFRSVGSRRQLRSLLRSGSLPDGVSIHERLLDEEVVAALRARVATVVTWPVNTLERAGELARLGVHGLISDRPSLLLGTR